MTALWPAAGLFLTAAVLYFRLARRPNAPAWAKHACAGCVVAAGLSGLAMSAEAGFEFGGGVFFGLMLLTAGPVIWSLDQMIPPR